VVRNVHSDGFGEIKECIVRHSRKRPTAKGRRSLSIVSVKSYVGYGCVCQDDAKSKARADAKSDGFEAGQSDEQINSTGQLIWRP
jgi:hypothetical protein